MYNLYQCNHDDSARFILGKNGDKKLFVVGLNPSTANKEKSDPTVAKVETVAKNNNYDGFVMLNLCPLRSTDPKALPIEADKELIELNIQKIIALAKNEQSPAFWAAWGGDIVTREYLSISLNNLIQEVKKLGGTWLSYGEPTNGGHPRHPSRLSYSWELSEFDIASYAQKFA